MTIHLDHTIVPARDKVASARRLAEQLGEPAGGGDLVSCRNDGVVEMNRHGSVSSMRRRNA